MQRMPVTITDACALHVAHAEPATTSGVGSVNPSSLPYAAENSPRPKSVSFSSASPVLLVRRKFSGFKSLQPAKKPTEKHVCEEGQEVKNPTARISDRCQHVHTHTRMPHEHEGNASTQQALLEDA